MDLNFRTIGRHFVLYDQKYPLREEELKQAESFLFESLEKGSELELQYTQALKKFQTTTEEITKVQDTCTIFHQLDTKDEVILACMLICLCKESERRAVQSAVEEYGRVSRAVTLGICPVLHSDNSQKSIVQDLKNSSHVLSSNPNRVVFLQWIIEHAPQSSLDFILTLIQVDLALLNYPNLLSHSLDSHRTAMLEQVVSKYMKSNFQIPYDPLFRISSLVHLEPEEQSALHEKRATYVHQTVCILLRGILRRIPTKRILQKLEGLRNSMQKETVGLVTRSRRMKCKTGKILSKPSTFETTTAKSSVPPVKKHISAIIVRRACSPVRDGLCAQDLMMQAEYERRFAEKLALLDI